MSNVMESTVSVPAPVELSVDQRLAAALARVDQLQAEVDAKAAASKSTKSASKPSVKKIERRKSFAEQYVADCALIATHTKDTVKELLAKIGTENDDPATRAELLGAYQRFWKAYSVGNTNGGAGSFHRAMFLACKAKSNSTERNSDGKKCASVDLVNLYWSKVTLEDIIAHVPTKIDSDTLAIVTMLGNGLIKHVRQAIDIAQIASGQVHFPLDGGERFTSPAAVAVPRAVCKLGISGSALVKNIA